MKNSKKNQKRMKILKDVWNNQKINKLKKEMTKVDIFCEINTSKKQNNNLFIP